MERPVKHEAWTYTTAGGIWEFPGIEMGHRLEVGLWLMR